jgi:FdhE protein
MNKERISDLRTRINQLKVAREDLHEPLDFYSKILDAYEGFDASLCGEPFAPPSAAAHGPYPFISLGEAELDWNAAFPLFRSLCKAFIDNVDAEEDVESASEASDEDAAGIIRNAFRVFITAGAGVSAEPTDEVTPQLAFISFLAMRPFVDAYVAGARALLDNEDGVYEATCPVCGGLAAMSILVREEGHRHLVCSACETSWLYKRTRCHLCGNEEPKTMGYIMAEGPGVEDCYTAVTCEKCKQYHRTLDTRKKRFELDIALEAIAAAHLEILAQREGYSPAPGWRGLDNSN